jgi:hypothetical protein
MPEVPADAEHGAIAADDQAQVAVPAQAIHVERGVVCQACVQGRLGIEHDFAALAPQEVGNARQRMAGTLGRGACAGSVVFPDQGNVAKRGRHFWKLHH